jgi:hypothetical protein
MSEEVKNETPNQIPCIEAAPQPVGEAEQKPRVKSKRDIFRFAGEKPTAINLEHVTQMGMDGKRITFQFYSTAMYIDLADDAAAASVFEVLLNIWAGEAQ